jgi:hypothetical protein
MVFAAGFEAVPFDRFIAERSRVESSARELHRKVPVGAL